MKKNRVALILVLFVVCSYPVFSDQEICEPTQEYYFGLIDGRTHSPWLWGQLGLGLTAMGVIFSVITDLQGWYPSEASESMSLPDPLGPGIGTAISIALPLAIKPKPKVIPDYIAEEDLECYLDGYGKTAKLKNTRGALIGCAVGWVAWVYFRRGLISF